ncbi:MAG: type II secretion system protein [Gammaproteobacteria bacterium]|nr:type II secretion system protein [Gammaproteobacteria bacterium]MYH16707.1 type II secretion system protein [Gammaproteobacteria bacterium]MYK81437.1 type II secretion system protein [Gammaproteobacteria bacterium]
MRIKEWVPTASNSGVGRTRRLQLRGAASSGIRMAGYTLVEVGLVIGLMGILAVAVADHYLSQLRFERSDRRVEGAVSDVRSVVDAAILWRESHRPSLWPHEANTIDAQPLVDDGFLPFLPPNRYRYFQCGNPIGCTDYELTGWDRSMAGGPPPGYTDDPLEAEDLVVQFNVWGLGEAKLIASQLPFGRVLDQTPNQVGSEGYTIETRILGDALGGEYVLLNRESRPVVFAAEVDPITNELHPEGDLQQVARITAGAPPVGSNQADDLSEAVTPGIRLQPDQATMNAQGSFGGKIHIDGPVVINIDQNAQFIADPDDPQNVTTVNQPTDGIVLVMRDSNGNVIGTSTLSQLQDQITQLAIDLAAHSGPPHP